MQPKKEDTTSNNVKNILNSPIGSFVEWEGELIEPKKKTYKGKTFLLTGPFTRSSAVNFAVTIKDYNLATFVGEAIGGLASAYGDRGCIWHQISVSAFSPVDTNVLLKTRQPIFANCCAR
jgi:hypothetical protein